MQQHRPPPPRRNYPQHPPSMDPSRLGGAGVYPPPVAGAVNHMAMSNGRGGGTHTAYPASPPMAEKPKVHPSDIPHPPLFTRPQQDMGVLPVFYTKQPLLQDNVILPPPPSDSRYVVVDDGNASPDMMRSSVYAMPLNRGVWHHTGDLPLGVLCSPLTVHSEDYVPRPRQGPPSGFNAMETSPWKDPQAVPVVGRSAYTGDGPPRCDQCMAYLNPFFDPADGACNLCGYRNRSLRHVMHGLPMQFGTVEYDVAGPYETREEGPVQPISLYAIDLTCPDAAAYVPLIERVGLDMAEHFDRQRPYNMTGPPPAPPRIGIVLVSCLGLILRPLHPESQRSSVVVVSDITEQPFCPLPLSDWTYDLSTAEGCAAWQRHCREDVLHDVQEWREHTARHKTAVKHADGFELSCGGAALQFLSDALAASGGRGTWISWRCPNYGVGTLPHRLGNQKLYDDDTVTYTPLQLLPQFANPIEEMASQFYKTLGAACVKNRTSLDVIIHTRLGAPNRALELATLGELCTTTSGTLSWITVSDWQQSLYESLARQVLSYCGWDAVFKIRCSEGIQVKSFYPSSGVLIETSAGDSSELELSSLHPSTTIAIEFEYRVGGISKSRRHVYIQTALLYSTFSGKRRVRVSTLALRTTSNVNEVYRSVDFNTLISFFTRSASQCLHTTSVSDPSSTRMKARTMIYQKCINTLACYRQYTTAITSPMGQLILPEKMSLLPLYCMCLLKSLMLRPSSQRMIPGMQASVISPTNDERAYFNYNVSQCLSSFAILMVHPYVFSIAPYLMDADDNLSGQWQAPDEIEQANGLVRMPDTIGPSMEFLSDDGIYLIDDGLRVFLYVGRFVPDQIKQEFMDPQRTSSELKQRIDVLLHQLRVFASTTRGNESELRPTWAPLVRVLQHPEGPQQQRQATLETDVWDLMVADANSGEKDYVDFLRNFHRKIRERIENIGQRIKQ
jgi:protein transport protein SEC24